MWFKKTQIVGFTYLLMSAHITFTGYAQEIAKPTRIDQNYGVLLENKKYYEAFKLISSGNDIDSIIQIAIHYLYGVGVKQDKCKAVSFFERAYPKAAIRSVSGLNVIYRSSWKSIASLEGSAAASFELGMYYYSFPKELRLSFLDINNVFLKNAYIHFKRAQYFGDDQAKKFIDRILNENPEFEQNIDVNYEKIGVICPVRGEDQ